MKTIAIIINRRSDSCLNLDLKQKKNEFISFFQNKDTNVHVYIAQPRDKRRAFSVFYTRYIKRQTLLSMGLKTLVLGKNIENIQELEQLWVETLTLNSHKKRLKVAIDGEVKRLHSPLTFSIHPHSLRVIMPSQNQKWV